MKFIAIVLLLLLPTSALGEEIPLNVLAGQMLMVGFRGLDAPDGSIIARAVRELHIGGVVLFDRDLETRGQRNVRDAAQVARLTAELQAMADIPLLLAVDQEGGAVRRFKPKHGFPDLASHAELGKGAPQATRQAARETGLALAKAGVNLDFAPVLDVAVNPDGPVIAALGRSFGADPKLVAEHGAAFAQGLRDAGPATSCKHFPGHGSATADSHTALPDISQVWTRAELDPFRRLIGDGLCDTVMVAHLQHDGLDPDQPASLSKAVVTDLLRGELGFSGVIITDDLQMAAVARGRPLKDMLALAVDAGADILLLGNNLKYDPDLAFAAHRALLELVGEGRLSRERLLKSHQRIQKLKSSLKIGACDPMKKGSDRKIAALP